MPDPQYLSTDPNAGTPVSDDGFKRWYAGMAKRHDLNPDPDSQPYDYRAAFKAGAKPDASGHWPSDFKKAGHPNMVVGGFNVKTGERVPGAKRAKDAAELVSLGWDQQTADKLARTPEPAAGGYLSTDPNAGTSEKPEDRGPSDGKRRLPATLTAGERDPLKRAFMAGADKQPGASGALAASLLAAPFTGGLSLPAGLAAEAAIGAGGALVGHGANAASTGESDSFGDIAKDAAFQGAFGAGGRALGGALQFVGNKLRGFKAPSPENAGGRLVPKPKAGGSVEDEMASVVAEARAPVPPERVTLPPAAPQPRVTYPRQAPAKAGPKPAQSRPTPAPTPQPAANAATPAAPAKMRGARVITPADLPEAWKPFAGEVPASAPTAQLAPRVSEAPMGLTDDVPMWGRTPEPAGNAGEMRRALGADEAGAHLGMSADDVRAASGYTPHRRPMVAELAEMDRNYLRRITDDRGEVDLRLLKRLASTLGLGGAGSMFGPVGAVAGVAAANPAATGRVMHEAGKLPTADMIRAAFLAAMGASEEQ
jgi:hypothetical protein